jgi:transposase
MPTPCPCVMMPKGWEASQNRSFSRRVASPGAIGKFLGGLEYAAIGLESGQLSIWLCKALRGLGYPAVCVDARHMAAALGARTNKNDRNDARGIARMMQAGLYKEVHVKSEESCARKVLLGSRRQLVGQRQQLKGTVRGLLKIYGHTLGKGLGGEHFAGSVRKCLEGMDTAVRVAITALLDTLAAVGRSLAALDKKLHAVAGKDATCRRLMTIPGVGAVTAMTYLSAVDDPRRFEQSETVGAYMGLTPRQYASGEVNRHGSISRMGPAECRHMLYEAAQALLMRCRQQSALKKWGLKLMKKKGRKKAVVAVARKLSIIMHRMLMDGTEFCPQC